MPKQVFTLTDLCAPLVLAAAFTVVVGILTFLFNFIFIRRSDEITAFEKLGAKYNVRIGVHRISLVKASLEKHVDEDGHVY